MIKKSYIICSTGRTGSTLLARTLGDLGYIGKPQEYWHEKTRPPLVETDSQCFKDYLAEIIKKGTTDNGVFGMKTHWSHFELLVKSARQHLDLKNKTYFEIISTLFPNLSFIHIKRDELAKQAISAEIANQTGIFNVGKLPDQNRQLLLFKPLNIYRRIKWFEQDNKKWKNFFASNSINYYEVIYEDFTRSTQSIQETIIDVINFLKIKPLPEPSKIKVPIVKLSNKTNESWYYRYTYIPEKLLYLVNLISSRFTN